MFSICFTGKMASTPFQRQLVLIKKPVNLQIQISDIVHPELLLFVLYSFDFYVLDLKFT